MVEFHACSIVVIMSNGYYTFTDGKKTSKLFTTLHIRKVTLEDDSQYGPLGRYECHAYAVGEPTVRKHGFGVNVIKSTLS